MEKQCWSNWSEGATSMNALSTLVAFALALANGTTPYPNGKFYSLEHVPPGVPYQRAILWHSSATETLLIQSQFTLPGADSNASLGWVVPVPGVPEVASAPADQTHDAFRHLGFVTRPTTTRILPLAFFLGLPVLTVVMLALVILSLFRPIPRWACRGMFLPEPPVQAQRAALGKRAAILFVCWVLAAISTPTFSASGVDVISSQRAGIYDVQVVTATDAAPLIEWLNEQEFEFADSDREVFNRYLDAGWSFAVAKVRPRVRVMGEERIVERLIAPLILRFAADDPVYPMALTGTVGRETEVLLYIYSDHKIVGDGRLELHAALETGSIIAGYLETDPPEFLTEREKELTYITKFKGVLTPQQMREDLVFSVASDDEPYRKHIVRF